MRGLLALGIIALGACGGTGVREVRNANGEAIYEAKCKAAPDECLADARAQCPNGYEVLESDSHAGGTIADVLPGPVTWYAMTFKCGGDGGERPAFSFRGPAPHRWSPPPEQRASTPAQAGCRSDYDCGMGRYCVKDQFRFEGTCATVVNELGTPTYAAPRGDSMGPGGEGQCAFDTECGLGFKCVKGGALKGHCMK